MPAVTVATVISGAQSLLNDSSGSTYTGAILLPYIKMAYEHLRNELALNEVPTLNTRQTAQTITAGNVVLTTVPTDLLLPIKIEERLSGSSEFYVEMEEKTWVPDETQTDRLRYWAWIAEAVAFLGATSDRQIRLYYLADLAPTSITTGSTIAAANSRSYLEARAAALTAMFVIRDASLAQAAQMVADDQLDKIIKIAVKERQALPARRRPFTGMRRRMF